jgi:hypothetical protein
MNLSLAAADVVQPRTRSVRAAEPHPKSVRPSWGSPVHEVTIIVTWDRLNSFFGSEKPDGMGRGIWREGATENVAGIGNYIAPVPLQGGKSSLKRSDATLAVREQPNTDIIPGHL